MGNKNARGINKSASREQRTIGNEADRFNNYVYGRLPEAGQHGRAIWDKSFNTYNDILDGSFGGRSGGSGGGLGEYESFFKNFGGGIDPTAQNRIRGNGVFDEYSKTGGFTQADKTDFMNQSTGAVPKFYEGIQNELDRMKGVQGGYSPGFDAQSAKIAREKTQAGQDAILNANVNLKNIIDSNRKWGTEGMSSSEMGLQDMLTRNKLQSMGQAASLRGQQNDDDYRWSFGALDGLQNLYSATPGEENMLLGHINDSRQIRGNQSGANIDRRMQYNPNVSGFDRVMQGVQTAAPLAMAAFGGPPGAAMAGAMGGNRASHGGGGNFAQFTQGPQINNPFQRSPYSGGFGSNFNPFRR
jgi:hypothetical protein